MRASNTRGAILKCVPSILLFRERNSSNRCTACVRADGCVEKETRGNIDNR